MQLSSFMMDHGLTLSQAFHQPRLDVSGATRIIADKELPHDILMALQGVLPLVTARRTAYPYSFACPSGVMREGDMNMGCSEIMSPYADTVSGG
jgi:gamma-glutamyltranspeptidase/glutathione hydrolase